MRKFESDVSYHVLNLGTGYVIPANQVPADLYDPDQLRGETVEMNGKICKIVGVESYAIGRSKDNHPYQLDFTLVIAEEGGA